MVFLIIKLSYFLSVILGISLKLRFKKLVVHFLIREVFLLISLFLLIKVIFFALITKSIAIVIFFFITPGLLLTAPNFDKDFNYLLI